MTSGLQAAGASQRDNDNNPAGGANPHLVNYALAGLERCWMAQHGRWSHIYHLDGRVPANESLPHSDVFYTLNVLLGMSRINQIPASINVAEIFDRNSRLLLNLPVSPYAYGVALWASAELKLDLPPAVQAHIRALLADESRWWTLRAQDIGMLLSGVVAQARLNGGVWNVDAHRLFGFLASRYFCQSTLFFDSPAGVRRRFGSFATQTYLALACYHYGEYASDNSALAMANACVRTLIALQGPMGEWPWFFDVKSGRVLDFYEIYSVHQYGMAPAFLECAERHGVLNAREALIKGFNWVLGHNALSVPMIVPDLQLTIRSQLRRREMHTKGPRAMRAIRNACLKVPAAFVAPGDLALRQECRSYELGWILWSFGPRLDLAHISNNPAFLISGTQRINIAA
jgi:hypothetical protein